MFKRTRRLCRISLAVLGAAALLSGCEMEKQAKYKPYVQSKVFADQASARPPEPHTMPVGGLELEKLAAVALNPGSRNPLPATMENLRAGKRSFEIFCAPCHGFTGDGEGIVLKRGFPASPSLHTPEQRAKTDSHLYNVTMHGQGKSPPFKSMLFPDETWQLVAYLRALQKSQNVNANELTPEEREKLNHG